MDTPVSEFYAPRAAPDLGDPALDPPGTIRVEGGEDRHVRLFDPAARRAVRTSVAFPPWVLIAGEDAPPPFLRPGDPLSHFDVRDWTVVPPLFVTVPWTRTTGRVPHEGAITSVERGDMDVDSFRG